MKEQSDKFDEMVEHEEKIRLGEAGWRERYYEVRPPSVCWRCMSLRACAWCKAAWLCTASDLRQTSGPP